MIRNAVCSEKCSFYTVHQSNLLWDLKIQNTNIALFKTLKYCCFFLPLRKYLFLFKRKTKIYTLFKKRKLAGELVSWIFETWVRWKRSTETRVVWEWQVENRPWLHLCLFKFIFISTSHEFVWINHS